MSLQQDIIVRYRDEEHVRFELPAGLCEGEAAERLIAGIRKIEGVYRVDLYAGQRKLSVRFMAAVVDFMGLARGVSEIVEGLKAQSQAESFPSLQVGRETRHWRQVVRDSRPIRWLRAKYEEARETAAAAAILIRAGKRKPAAWLGNSDAAIDFFTDILVLYLIKTHWRLILNDWLRRPWQYRYEWTAVSYMIFLLVRSRMPKSE